MAKQRIDVLELLRRHQAPVQEGPFTSAWRFQPGGGLCATLPHPPEGQA